MRCWSIETLTVVCRTVCKTTFNAALHAGEEQRTKKLLLLLDPDDACDAKTPLVLDVRSTTIPHGTIRRLTCVVQIQLTTTPVIGQEWLYEKSVRYQRLPGRRPEGCTSMVRGISEIESFGFPSSRDSRSLVDTRYAESAYEAESERSARLSLPWISTIDIDSTTPLDRKENPIGVLSVASLATDVAGRLLRETGLSQICTLLRPDDAGNIEHRSGDTVNSAVDRTSSSSSPPLSVANPDECPKLDGDRTDSDKDLFDWLTNNFPEKAVIAEEDNCLTIGNPLRTGAWLSDSMHANRGGQVEGQRPSLVTLGPWRHCVVTSQVSIPTSRISLRPLQTPKRAMRFSPFAFPCRILLGAGGRPSLL